MGLDAGTRIGVAGGLQAIFLLGLHLDQGLMSPHQGAQGPVRGGWRNPGGRPFLAAKISDGSGIDRVGFGAEP